MRDLPQGSKFQFMWMLVFFDLPVTTKKARKEASDFRNFLLDHGFAMAQYSVYQRCFSSRDAMTKYYGLIQKHLPSQGNVSILAVTDKQFCDIVSYHSRKKTEKKQDEQLLLF